MAVVALNAQRDAGDLASEAEFLERLRSAVRDVVARQRGIGIDLVNDGEYGHWLAKLTEELDLY